MRFDGANLTMVGRVVKDPQLTSTVTGDLVRLRVVSRERRFDEQSGTWVDGEEYGVNVACWGGLARGVMDLVRKGDPLVICGRLSTRRVEREEKVDYFTDLRADVVAIDVAKANGRVKHVPPNERVADEPAADYPGPEPTEEMAALLDDDRELVSTG